MNGDLSSRLHDRDREGPRAAAAVYAPGVGAAALVFWRKAVRIGRRIVGVPDYERYVAHLREHHPGRAIPSYAEFFAERQRARYRGGGGGCC